MAIATCLVFLTLSIAPPLAAQNTQSADLPKMSAIEQAWQQQDFVFVRSALAQLAQETDSALAQYRYGRVLLEGRGGPTDIDGAVVWLQKAVDQNNAQAAALLARIYQSEFDQDEPLKTQRDPERAADLLHLSAALGFAEGQYELGRVYAAGFGVAQDVKAAFRWYLAAARQQHDKAQLAVAQAFLQGNGTTQDTPQAIHWLTQAAANNNARAQISLARAYETGNGVAKSTNQALEWYKRAAENGVPFAQRQLGARLLAGENGIPQDVPAALKWLHSAAEVGDPEAMAILGRAYFIGTGVTKNVNQAALWYGRAAQYDHGRAKVALGAMHESGQGVDQDMDKALSLYQRALDIPDGNRAAIRLGQLAASGELADRFAPHRMVPWVLAALQDPATSAQAEEWLLAQADGGLRDAQAGLASRYLADPEAVEKGVDLLQRAATAGDPEAQQRLGMMHMIGDNLPLDYVTAHSWFNIAATLGQLEAPELRATANALMTPDQIAEAQEKARNWFATKEPQPPSVDQTVTVTDP